jgi:hypothetical protein
MAWRITCTAFLLLSLSASLAFASGSTPAQAESRLLQNERAHFNAFAPNPGDTIRYDDGNLAYGLWIPDENISWAMRFTPFRECTLREAHVGIDVWSGTAPVCTLFVWDDNAGEPGSVLSTTSFSPMTGLNVVNIANLLVFPESTDFWIGYYLQFSSGPDSTLAVTDSGIDYDDRNGVRISGTWFSMSDVAGEGDLVIRAYVNYVTVHDVGVDSIVGLGDTVLTDSSYQPIAWVRNYGDTTESFGVRCRVGWFLYFDSLTVANLAPGADYECIFKAWRTPFFPDTFRACFWTDLPGDQVLSNDTLCKNVLVIHTANEESGVVTSAQPFLEQNLPNPFSTSTAISYQVSRPGLVEVFVYDAAGNLVRTLVHGEAAPGRHEVIWNGRNDVGLAAPDGVYFCKLTAGSFESSRKMILVR